MKIVTIFLTFIISSNGFAQKTFEVDASFLDTLHFEKYYSFIVSKDFGINFIDKEISKSDRFSPEISEVKAADKAIQTQLLKLGLVDIFNFLSNYSKNCSSCEA